MALKPGVPGTTNQPLRSTMLPRIIVSPTGLQARSKTAELLEFRPEVITARFQTGTGPACAREVRPVTRLQIHCIRSCCSEVMSLVVTLRLGLRRTCHRRKAVVLFGMHGPSPWSFQKLIHERSTTQINIS